MIYRSVMFLVFFFIGQIPAQAASSCNVSLAPDSAVWLEGDSTLHPFTSRTTQMQLTSKIDPLTVPAVAPVNDVFSAILQRQALKQFDLSIPVRGLKSKDSGLDKNMYKALKAGKCPAIEFHMTRYEVGSATSPATGSPVRASGTLRVACQEQSVALEGTLAQDHDRLRIQGRHSLLMTDYGVKPPKMMMGAIKTKNQVIIHFDLLLESDPTGRRS